MQYKSPIPLILHAGFDKEKLEIATIQRIQKRLLVELDHSGTGHVQVGEQQFTKDDILTMTEEMKDADLMNFHRMIFDSPRLLRLLEQGTIANMSDCLFNENLKWTGYFEKFREYVSPFLVQTVSKSLHQSIQKNDFATARKFLQVKDLIIDEDFDKTFGKVKHSLKSIIYEIKRTTKKEIVFNSSHFDFINHEFVVFMNELPEGFAGLREEMATALVDLSVPYQHSHKEFCHYLYLYLQYLNCSDSLKKLIISNAAIIKESVKSVKQEIGESSRGVWFFLFVFFLIIIILRSISCGPGRKNNYSRLELPTMPKSEVGHFFLQLKLHAIASRQLTPHGLDSLKKIVLTRPPGLDDDDRPYANRYLNLKNYKPSSGSVVKLTNKSAFDVVIFVRNDTKAFSSFLYKKDTMSMRLGTSDRLSFYVGNDWVNNITFESSDKLNTMRGIFMNVDSTTMHLLNEYYEFNCDSIPSCGPVRLDFESSGESGFMFKADQPNLFVLKKGMYISSQRKDRNF